MNFYARRTSYIFQIRIGKIILFEKKLCEYTDACRIYPISCNSCYIRVISIGIKYLINSYYCLGSFHKFRIIIFQYLIFLFLAFNLGYLLGYFFTLYYISFYIFSQAFCFYNTKYHNNNKQFIYSIITLYIENRNDLNVNISNSN